VIEGGVMEQQAPAPKTDLPPVPAGALPAGTAEPAKSAAPAAPAAPAVPAGAPASPAGAKSGDVPK